MFAKEVKVVVLHRKSDNVLACSTLNSSWCILVLLFNLCFIGSILPILHFHSSICLHFTANIISYILVFYVFLFLFALHLLCIYIGILFGFLSIFFTKVYVAKCVSSIIDHWHSSSSNGGVVIKQQTTHQWMIHVFYTKWKYHSQDLKISILFAL